MRDQISRQYKNIFEHTNNVFCPYIIFQYPPWFLLKIFTSLIISNLIAISHSEIKTSNNKEKKSINANIVIDILLVWRDTNEIHCHFLRPYVPINIEDPFTSHETMFTNWCYWYGNDVSNLLDTNIDAILAQYQQMKTRD